MDYRIYFDKAATELPWSIDEGDQSTEVQVARVEGYRVSFEFCFDPTIPLNPDKPRAWMVVRYATLRIEDGVAKFFHDPHWRRPSIADGREQLP